MFGTKAKKAIVTLQPRTTAPDQTTSPDKTTTTHQKSLTEPIPAPQPPPQAPEPVPPRPNTLGPTAAPAAGKRIFKIEKPRGSYIIAGVEPSAAGQPLHLVDIRTSVRGSSDLLLHQTGDPSSAVILAGDLGQGKRRNYRVGPVMEDGKHPWLEMKRESWNMTKHTWAFPPPWQSPSSSSGGGSGPSTAGSQRRELSWRRTRSLAVEGYKIPRWNSRCLKLVDDGSGDVLAVFTRVTSWGQCGVLQVNVGWGPEFDRLVFLTALLIEEKIERQEMEAVIGDSGERR